MKNLSIRPQLLLSALLLLLALPALWSCSQEDALTVALREHQEQQKIIDEDTISRFAARTFPAGSYTRTSTGLYVVNITTGTGAAVTAGRQVRVKYIGRFRSNGGNTAYPVGSIFDNSTDNVNSSDQCGCAVFTAGSGAIPGFSEGLLLMRQGDRKRFLIPSYLAYGYNGKSPNIPPDAVLDFDVELLSILP
jgi:FKBP-type peptidyl-prolyl cis-trans isomerase